MSIEQCCLGFRRKRLWFCENDSGWPKTDIFRFPKLPIRGGPGEFYEYSRGAVAGFLDRAATHRAEPPPTRTTSCTPVSLPTWRRPISGWKPWRVPLGKRDDEGWAAH
jgi:hypothetical protein